MIYCQLRPEAELPLGAPLRLGNVARLIAPEGAEDIPLPCPDREGVWRLDALLCARALRAACPGEEVRLRGADSCYTPSGEISTISPGPSSRNTSYPSFSPA